MNDVAPHSGSRWEPRTGAVSPSTATPPAPAVLVDQVPAADTTGDSEERDRRRRPWSALVALLALLVLSLSGARAAWGDQVRALVHPQAPAVPASDPVGGSQPWGPGEPGEGCGHSDHGGRFDGDGDGPHRGDHRPPGAGDQGSNGDDGTSGGTSGTQGGA